MSTWNFDGALLKTKRADQHIQDLNLRLNTFLQGEFHRLSVEHDLNTGNDFLKFNKFKPVPDDISLIIGDSIHNLRSALDFIAYEIVNSAGINASDVHFPFRETREELIRAIDEGKIKRASGKAADFIFDTIKPYKAGDPFIWALNKLANIDKHRLLIATITKTEIPNVVIERHEKIGNNLGAPIITESHFIIESNESIDFTGLSAYHIKIKGHGEATFQVFFDVDQFAQIPKLDILTMLNHLSKKIKTWIVSFNEL